MSKFNWTPKREQFCIEYIVDFNGAQAAIRAGFAQKGAAKAAFDLMQKPEIAERVMQLIQARSNRTEIDADYVLNRLVEIDQMDVLDILNDDGSLKLVSEWPKVWRTYISGMDLTELFDGRGDEREMTGLMKKIKWPDKVKNLELIGKHVNVQAFKDRVEHSGVISHEEALEQLA